jgi:hypothetical protein
VKSCQYKIIRYWGIPDGTGFFAANISLICVFKSESDSELEDDGEEEEEEGELELELLESLESEDAFIMCKKREHQCNGYTRTVRVRA